MGDGHVAQHPIYPELLLVSDKELRRLTILNTDNGEQINDLSKSGAYLVPLIP